MLYRYELSVDGNLQGVGILQGLRELLLDKDEEDFLLSPFDADLPIPKIPLAMTKSFFTELGHKRFEHAIRMVVGEYEDDDFFDVALGLLSDADKEFLDVVYEDSYQVIFADNQYLAQSIEWDMDYMIHAYDLCEA